MAVKIPYTHNIQVWLKRPDGCKVLKSRHERLILHVATYRNSDKPLFLLAGNILGDQTVPRRWEEFNLDTGESRDVYLQRDAVEDKLVEFKSVNLPGSCEGINWGTRYFDSDPVFIGPLWFIATLLNSQGALTMRLLTLGIDFSFLGCEGGKFFVFEGRNYDRVIVCPLR